MQHGGIIDEYTGDGLKADFGVPIPRTTEAAIRQDALNAVRCALAMAEDIRRLNVRWRERGLPEMSVRIGICTGSVIAGSLGGAERLKYTTVGDTVNIASRLESLNKDAAAGGFDETPCRILVAEETYRHVHGRVSADKVGEVSLKGRRQTMTVYRIVGPVNDDNDPVTTKEAAE
jgi:class 3 adenylate cyclase